LSVTAEKSARSPAQSQDWKAWTACTYRIIVHANEHMGQLVAYARMNGIVPPWSQ